MKFKCVRFRNILSYGNNWTELQLDSNEIIAISASNASGKSVLVDVLHYVLTGKPYRNINKPQLVNQFNKKELLVELELEFKGSDIFIRRGMFPNVFEIYKDGKNIEENSSIKDFQVVLENMLEIDSKTIKQTMLMSSRYYTPFLQLFPADKRSFIESILSIKMFSSMCDNLKQRTTNLKQEETFLVKDLDKVRSNITLLQDVNKKQKKEIEKEKKAINKRITDLRHEVETNLKKVGKHNSHIQTQQEQIIHLQERLVNAGKVQEKNTKLQLDLDNLKKRTDFFYKNEICPLCTQSISPEVKQDRLDEFAKLNEKINEKLTKLNEMLGKIQKINRKIQQLNSDNMTVLQEIQQLNTENRGNERQITVEQSEFNRLIEKSQSDEDVNIKKFQEEKLGIETRRNNITNEILKCNDLVKLLSEKGIKKFILRKYIPVLNKLVNNYLTMLDAKYQILFDDEVNEKIVARGYEELSYNSFSGGERQRVDLALLFSFLELSKLKNSVDTNLLILDETLDTSLDPSGINGVFSVLQHLKRQGYTIIVITHREIEDQFDKTYRVTKKRYSEIEEI